jgi:hypothetical protein
MDLDANPKMSIHTNMLETLSFGVWYHRYNQEMITSTISSKGAKLNN